MKLTTYLDEVEQRIGKATPGPWVHKRSGGGCVIGGPAIEYTNGSAQSQLAMVTTAEWMPAGQRDANADLIAHAPTDLKTLIAVVRKQREALEDIDCKIDCHDAASTIASTCISDVDAMIGGKV